jgi:hypothetical protein
MSSKISFPLLISSCMFFSCQSESTTASNGKPNYEQTSLIGRWELQKGYRNNKETETLTGTYYEFTEETMKTNLTPTTMEQTYKYSYSDNEIKQKGEVPIIYSVDSLTSDFLAMRMTINNYPFMLHLKKAVPPAELEASDTTSGGAVKEL